MYSTLYLKFLRKIYFQLRKRRKTSTRGRFETAKILPPGQQRGWIRNENTDLSCIFSQTQKLAMFKTKTNNCTRYNINKWEQSFSCNQSKKSKTLRPLHARKKITTSQIWNSNRMSYLTSEIHELIRSLVITDVFGTAQNPICHQLNLSLVKILSLNQPLSLSRQNFLFAKGSKLNPILSYQAYLNLYSFTLFTR